jgi:YidC/Oxa1 family membrane protein insertase
VSDRSPPPFSTGRLIMFFVLSFALMQGYAMLMAWLHPRLPEQVAKNEQNRDKGKEKENRAAPAGKQPEAKQSDKEKPAAKPEPGKKPAPVAKEKVASAVKWPRTWTTLGSADEADPYRMLVTLSSEGAALVRVELNSARYHEFMEYPNYLEDHSGYLGELVIDDEQRGPGCPVQVVGPGTPAAKAGLKPGDRILSARGRTVADAESLRGVLKPTKPKQTIEVVVLRDGKQQTLSVTLAARPLQVVRPENNDPYSLLATLQQVDDQHIAADEPDKAVDVAAELKGVDLRHGNWQLVEHDQGHAVFRRSVPERGVEITKTFTLESVPKDQLHSADYPAYNLKVDVSLRNISQEKHKLAYRLDGPNGLPTEGWWYAYKIGHGWGATGLRDVAFGMPHSDPKIITCSEVSDDKLGAGLENETVSYLAVDAQYFAAALIPDEDTADNIQRATAMRVGDVPMLDKRPFKTVTNASFRIVSKTHELAPGKTIADHFVLFAGPKKPPLLTHYGLDKLVYYGWFFWIAQPMLAVLHTFYFLVRNYGIAVIMLTVLVRLCMFPFSRKQALGAQKMQLLQPEMKRLQEKYKKDPEGRTKAQQELFRKHNYNPLSGCLVLFIQLPIFVGLYNSLKVDVELRDASLLGHGIRFCSNLAAPDMLIDWSSMWNRFGWDWVNHGQGMFSFGPYLNLLPMLTIVLFILQQKMFMPPATDEQTAMQQKVMKYMMIFMGLMFFKVASGLCIYFIASSLWGLAERKFLPKTVAAGAADATGEKTPWTPTLRESAATRRKKRKK